MKRILSRLLVSASCAILLACGGGADKGTSPPPTQTVPVVPPPVLPPPPAPVLQSIAVTPANVSLNIGDSQTLSAVGVYSDGNRSGLATGVVWSASGAAASVNAAGVVSAVALGNATVSATLGGVVGSASIAVTPVPVVGTPYKSVAVGYFHTLAVRTDGALYAWGWNRSGQLGDATRLDRTAPTRIGSGSDWTAVAAGEYHSLAIKADGTLWAWGLNTDGQLGLGDTNLRLQPVQVGKDKNWTAVVAGKNHTLALKSDATLWAWGRNFNGQLGVAANDVSNRTMPTQVGAATTWTAVAAGADHSLALQGNVLWAWGLNDDGQLGDNTVVQKTVPTAVDGTNTPNTQWAAVAGGGRHTLAVRTDSALFVWGSNAQSQLGSGLAGPVLVPTRWGLGADWELVAAGATHSLAKKRDGTLWVWGDNARGQLGSPSLPAVVATPTQLGSATDWAQPLAGLDTSFVQRNNNQMLGWGRNGEGQLGNGTLADLLAPAVVP